MDLYKKILNKKLLTKQEEFELSKRKRNGDLKARNKLIEHNLRLVVSIVKRYAKNPNDYQDLMTEGILGLINGIDKFDERKGYKVSTYVSWWIAQSVLYSLNNNKMIKTGSYSQKLRKKTDTIRKNHKSSFGEEIDESKLLKILEITPEKAKKHKIYQKIEITNDDGLENNLFEENKEYKNSIRNEIINTIMNVIDNLNEKEKNIFYMRCGINTEKTDYRTISQSYKGKVNHSTVRNIFLRVLEQIAQKLCIKYEQKYDNKKIKKLISEKEFQKAITEIAGSIE